MAFAPNKNVEMNMSVLNVFIDKMLTINKENYNESHYKKGANKSSLFYYIDNANDAIQITLFKIRLLFVS